MKRKRLILWMVCWLIGLSIGNAQPNKSFRFGIIGGVNAGLIKNRSGYQSILWRYNAGFTAERRFSSSFSLTSQLIYTIQGETVNLRAVNTSIITDKEVIRFDYIALPIMLRVRPKGERVFMEIGGQAGYLIQNTSYLTTQPNQIRTFNHTQPIDMGLTGGIGYRLGRHIVVDARYYYGMRSLFRWHNRVDPQTGQVRWVRQSPWYNRVWSVNLSYYF